MIQESHEAYEIRGPGDAAAARRAAARLAERLGVSREEAERAELVSSQIASSLLRQDRPGGVVLLRALHAAGGCGTGVEILGLEAGPGSADLAAGLASLGGIATVLDIFTRPRFGTVVLARIESRAAPPAAGGFWVGGLSVPLLPAEGNGDGWAVRSAGDELSLLVVDGLGHGAEAQRAALAALALFESGFSGDLARFVSEANQALRPTRGAAASLCHIVPRDGKVHFVGLGNVDGCVVAGGRRQGFLTRNGTLGMNLAAPTAPVRSYQWPAGGATLVLHSDGVRDGFEFAAHPDLLLHHPAVIAAAIYRDQRRSGDDATVAVVQMGRSA